MTSLSRMILNTIYETSVEYVELVFEIIIPNNNNNNNNNNIDNNNNKNNNNVNSVLWLQV